MFASDGHLAHVSRCQLRHARNSVLSAVSEWEAWCGRGFAAYLARVWCAWYASVVLDSHVSASQRCDGTSHTRPRADEDFRVWEG